MPESRTISWALREEVGSNYFSDQLKLPNEKRYIRKFINSAIYVEKPINEMPPLRKTSTICLNDHDVLSKSLPILGQVSSTSITGVKTDVESNREPESGYRTSDNSSNPNSSPSDSDSQVTIKYADGFPPQTNSDLKLSLQSLNTDRTSTFDPKEREEIVRKWLQKKDELKRKKQLEETTARELKEKQRQMMLERERENFKRWLSEKRKKEETRKKEKELEEQEKTVKEAEKEKKQVESEISYQLWLRKKKKIELEKKIKEKVTLLQIAEERQRRAEQNEIAYKEWLKTSKNKPKPIPLNQGLKSLCSSLSVTYINPMPWHPNIELSQKPASQ